MRKFLALIALGAVSLASHQVDAQVPASPSEFAYAWFDGGAANGGYQYNSRSPSSNGANTITRSTTGHYEVVFGGMTGAGGNVQVAPYGGPISVCNVVMWTKDSAGVHVQVACFDDNGAAADSKFAIEYENLGEPDRVGQTAYAWSNNATSASQVPFNATYAVTGAGAYSQRSAQGNYVVNLPFRGSSTSRNFGTIAVTAYGVTPARCAASTSAVNAGDGLFVSCRTPQGAPVDVPFTISRSRATTSLPMTIAGYANVDASNAVGESYSTNGRGVSVSGAGTELAVVFSGLGGAGGTAKITPATPGTPCRINSWGPPGADARVSVSCGGGFRLQYGRMDQFGR